MAKQLFDQYDGLTEWFDYDEDTGKAYITTEEDVSLLLDVCAEKRNQGNDKGIRSGFWHYCKIPVTVQMALLGRGIDCYNPEHQKRMLQEINQNYPHLKTTTKTHA